MYDRIVMDFSYGLQKLVENILLLKPQGSIGYIGGYYVDNSNNNIVIGKSRHQSLITILISKGIYHSEYFHIGKMTRESGYTLTKAAIDTNTMPQSVILGNDEIAQGAIKAINDSNLEINKDVYIYIYKDIETSLSSCKDYGELQMFPDYMWELAIKLLIERISGKRNYAMTTILPPKLNIPNLK